uniref:Uncharacterized protein n=1 Tax=Mycena chlorophos TaxID=658473 RepID=A0ABQ0KX51_MYCCL|nr:predicted protein [Mycena chlorophos]
MRPRLRGLPEHKPCWTAASRGGGTETRSNRRQHPNGSRCACRDSRNSSASAPQSTPPQTRCRPGRLLVDWPLDTSSPAKGRHARSTANRKASHNHRHAQLRRTHPQAQGRLSVAWVGVESQHASIVEFSIGCAGTCLVWSPLRVKTVGDSPNWDKDHSLDIILSNKSLEDEDGPTKEHTDGSRRQASHLVNCEIHCTTVPAQSLPCTESEAPTSTLRISRSRHDITSLGLSRTRVESALKRTGTASKGSGSCRAGLQELLKCPENADVLVDSPKLPLEASQESEEFEDKQKFHLRIEQVSPTVQTDGPFTGTNALPAARHAGTGGGPDRPPNDPRRSYLRQIKAIRLGTPSPASLHRGRAQAESFSSRPGPQATHATNELSSRPPPEKLTGLRHGYVQYIGYRLR